MTKQIETGKAIDKGTTEKVTTPKKVNGRTRNSVNGNHAKSLKIKAGKVVFETAHTSVQGLESLKGKNAQTPVNGKRNLLGHMISDSCSVGGKNVLVDSLIIHVVDNNGKVSNDHIVDILCYGKVNPNQCKQYNASDMRSKYAAHIKHYARGKNCVPFKPQVAIDENALVALAYSLKAQVDSALKMTKK